MCPPPPGPNCEINLDDCASNPCDSGTCLDKIDGYECACEPGYTGERPQGLGTSRALFLLALVTALPQGPSLCSRSLMTLGSRWARSGGLRAGWPHYQASSLSPLQQRPWEDWGSGQCGDGHPWASCPC